MAACFMCKKDVTSGYVLCGDCAGKLKTNTLPHIMEYYITRLAASIAFDDTVYPCPMCEIEDCQLGKDGVTRYKCHKGISDWFRSKANEFFSNSTPGILGRLKMVCPFPEVYEDLDMSDGPGKGAPRRKIGHIRPDYDGCRWWSTVWAAHADLATAKIKAEIDSTYDALTAPDALANLDTLRRMRWPIWIPCAASAGPTRRPNTIRRWTMISTSIWLVKPAISGCGSSQETRTTTYI